MNILVIDVGGTHVKILATGQEAVRKFESGRKMSPAKMVDGVKQLAKDWKHEAISIGYPGFVYQNRIVSEPYNLAEGWAGFDFNAAFAKPVKIINDAAMQALGSYKGGKMLFLGLGTGLGSAMVVDGSVVPMELGHLRYKRATYEDYVGLRGLVGRGKPKWRNSVNDVIERLAAALQPDDIVLGGGNVKHLKALPKGCRQGDNANAFAGGFAIWSQEPSANKPTKSRATRK